MERSQRRFFNVSTGHVLELIAMAIGCAGRAKAQPKMWEFERDSGMSCVFCGIFKQKAGWLVTICTSARHLPPPTITS